MNSEQEVLQRRLAQFLVDDVFKTISSDDILKQNSNSNWTHKGAELTKGQVEVLKREAIAFSKTHLYTLLPAEIRYHAREALDRAQTESDIISAKLLSYFVDVLVSKLKKIAEL